MSPLRRLARHLVSPGREPGPTPTEMLVLRTLCHELRPPVSTLGSLLRALDRESAVPPGPAVHPGPGTPSGPGTRAGPADGQPDAGDDRQALARLAAAHTRHLEDLLRHAAAIAEGLSGSADDTPPVALAEVLPTATAVVPAGRLEVRVDEDAGRWPVHPRHTRQILINLLGNALRHGPPGGQITVLARTRGRSLLLIVRDEGSMTAELAHALRRDAAPAGMHGLGLWLVRQLAQRHGGSVTARPAVPSGVAVCVSLPRRAGLSRRGHRLAR